MENVLVVGTNTRPVACSAKKLNYKVYSVDYFCTKDLIKCSDNLRCILSQKPYESCGRYIEKFDPLVLESFAHEYADRVDYILFSSGVLSEKLPKSKIVGNREIEDIENKYTLYNKLKNKFKVPKTFSISSFEEASRIAEENKDKRFIAKPIVGAGGKGIRRFEDLNENSNLNGMILQELIEGEHISASVLSTGYEAKTILTSRQILGQSELGQKEPYAYCGNMVPHSDDPLIKKTAEDVITELSLVGSNGVDMVDNGEDIYLIEVNPRFQGTFECAEAVLGINMVDAHFKACNGVLIETPKPHGFAVKMIIFAKHRSIAGDLNLKDVYDIPEKNVIIEKEEPAATVITSGRTLEDALSLARNTVVKAYDQLKHCPEGNETVNSPAIT